MKMLAKMLGGSTAYGLNTPESDLDYRGIYMFTDIAKIIGLDKNGEHHEDRTKNDEVYYEFRHFLGLLRKTNSQVLELLFNKNWIEISDEFKLVIDSKFNLIDCEKMIKSLQGYMYGERRLANGERTGQLGLARHTTLDKYGYSPKNMVQLLRLGYCGKCLFEKGYFPVNIMKEDSEFGLELLDIKLHPEKYNVSELNLKVDKAELDLKSAYENRNFNYKFNSELANELCLKVYYPIIEQKFKSL